MAILYTADQPYPEQNDQHSTENATQAGSAVAAKGIVSAAAAEHHDKDDEDQKRAHGLPFKSGSVDPAEEVGIGERLHQVRKLPRTTLDPDGADQLCARCRTSTLGVPPFPGGRDGKVSCIWHARIEKISRRIGGTSMFPASV